jgi:hypothetical protein
MDRYNITKPIHSLMKTLAALGFLFLVVFSFDASRSSIRYTRINVIDSSPQTYPEKVGYRSRSEIDLMEHALAVTKTSLSFSLSSKGNSSISKISASKQAHCVGYAVFYNSILKKMFDENGMRHHRIEHVRAHIKMVGITVTGLIPDKRFADHDVCRITNTVTGRVYIVDPSLSEFFGKIIVNN